MTHAIGSVASGGFPLEVGVEIGVEVGVEAGVACAIAGVNAASAAKTAKIAVRMCVTFLMSAERRAIPAIAEPAERSDTIPRAMFDYQRDFIDFMLKVGVLSFGDFTTKSGRKTPYFVNTGKYRSGGQLAQLGRAYADAIERSFPEGFDCLFGPAYKGIPLVVAVAMAFAERGREVEFCFNRKEAKDHGEGGLLVGRKLQNGDRVLIVEDVTTAGTSIRETVPVLRAAADIKLAGLVVSVDRQERASDTSTRTALAEVGAEFAMPTAAIVTIDEVIEHLGARLTEADRARIAAYRAQYGAALV